jgi:hypothetical protein
MQVKQKNDMDLYGLTPIGQKQRRPMDGAQFHSSQVGDTGAGLIQNMAPSEFSRSL